VLFIVATSLYVSRLEVDQAAVRDDVRDLERALVARARAGDPHAFRRLFERYAPEVRRFLRGLLGESGAADEATQECFVRAHRRLDRLHDDGGLRAWLFGIARKVALEERRKQRRLRPAETLPERVDPGPSPEAMLLGSEGDRLLASALAGLEEERRAALLLRVDHGLGYDDIAAALGWSLAKVKNEIHRGRLELRERLGGYLGGAP
jgi:RNA polymerase sigma-70 factor (ECF subfamily)